MSDDEETVEDNVQEGNVIAEAVKNAAIENNNDEEEEAPEQEHVEPLFEGDAYMDAVEALGEHPHHDENVRDEVPDDPDGDHYEPFVRT